MRKKNEGRGGREHLEKEKGTGGRGRGVSGGKRRMVGAGKRRAEGEEEGGKGTGRGGWRGG